LFRSKPLPWPLDASVPLLDTFQVVRFPFIRSLIGEELFTIIVSPGCFETRECFTSFDMGALQLAFRIRSATKICSFNREICCASKSDAKIVFTIEQSRRKQKETVHKPLRK
jgi:hypothetical protein